MCICAYVLIGIWITFQDWKYIVTLGKWLMLGAYIRAPPRGAHREVVPGTGASETILLFPPGELYSPRVVLPRKLELFGASVLSSAPFLPCIFSVTF